MPLFRTSFESIRQFFSEKEPKFDRNIHSPAKNSPNQESQNSASLVNPSNQQNPKTTHVAPKQPKNYFYQENKDPMSEFVVVDFKESEPYNMEEWRLILANSREFQVEQPRLYSSLHQGVPRDLYFLFFYFFLKKFQRRKRIWLYLANVEELKKENAKKGSNLIENFCKNLMNSFSHL